MELKTLEENFLQNSKNKIINAKPYLKILIEKWEIYKEKNNIQILPATKRGYYVSFLGTKLCSGIDPVNEAERIIQNIKLDSKIIFLFGIGNIYLISDLLKKRNNNQITIIIENNQNLLSFYWFFWKDFHQYLNTPNCHIFTESNQELLWNYLNSLSIEKVKRNLILKHNPSYKLHISYYSKVEETIHFIFKSNFSNLLTKFEFEKLWFANILINSNYLHKDFPYNKLIYYKDYFRNFPFVIIGAGPSLKNSKEILHILKNKAILFATDASLKPLLKMGIKPDMVFILDAQIHSIFHFLNVTYKDIIVFSDLVVHPVLLRKINFPYWIFTTTVKYGINPQGKLQAEKTKGINIIENIVGEIGSIQSGGSVSTSAFEIARYLGAKIFLLIGQDLAWTNRQLHCVDTHHYEKWYSKINRVNSLENINENIFKKRSIIKIKGIQKTYTYGDHVLNIYRKWFEETAMELQSMDNIKIYNLTYDGSCIENMSNISKEELLEFPDIQKYKILDEIKKNFSSNRIVYSHDQIEELVYKLYNLLKDSIILRNDHTKELLYFNIKKLSLDYPDLDVFIHKLDTYIERNEQKLSKERISHLRYVNLMQDLKKFIKTYISFKTSLIHSDVL